MIFLLDTADKPPFQGVRYVEERLHHGGLASAVQPAWG